MDDDKHMNAVHVTTIIIELGGIQNGVNFFLICIHAHAQLVPIEGQWNPKFVTYNLSR